MYTEIRSLQLKKLTTYSFKEIENLFYKKKYYRMNVPERKKYM